MESISHVNRYYYGRVLLIPLVFPLYLLKRRSCKKEAKRYVSGDNYLSLSERYERFLSLFERSIFLRKTSYTFISKKKILQVQTVFVVDEDISWNSLGLIRYLVKSYRHLPCIVLHDFLLNSKSSIIWDFIDTFYGIKDLEEAIRSKRSIVLEKNVIDQYKECAPLISSYRVHIAPIFVFKFKHRIFYKIGESIKPSDLAGRSHIAMSSMIADSFVSLEKEFRTHLSKKPKKKNWFREFFFIK